MTPYDEFSAATYAGAPPASGGANWRGFVAALIAGWLVLCALTWFVSMQRGLGGLRDAIAIRADRYAATLESTLDRYEFQPALVALHPFVRELLASPLDPAKVHAANRYLAEVNARSQASATYVIGTSGLGLAASNYDQPKSFIGFDYRFRPYFQSAMHGTVGRFYAIGITAEEPGYYIAQPVEEDGRIIGAAVVKLSLEWFQQAGAGSAEPVIVSDDHGIIFLSTVPAWRYRSLRPLSQEMRAELARTRQYHNKDVRPLTTAPLQSPATRWLDRMALGDDAQLLRITTDNRSERYMQVSRRVGPANWSMTAMAALDPVMNNARNATIVAALAYACVCLALLNWRLRRQRVRDIEYGRSLLEAAYDELERRVDTRTADLMATNEQLEAQVRERTRAEKELRAAQDELVQTSKLAALGQMAAGITHELNQPLAALRTFSDNTRVLLERGQIEAATGNLSAIADLTTRMGKITGQLKLFAGKARPRRQAVAVRIVLDHVLALMAPRMTDVQIDVEGVDVGDLAVWADELKLEQVLLNLVGNALDAMHAKAGQGGFKPHMAIVVSQGGEKITLAVRDNGTGIPENVLPKLFEPFFTTKEIGQGLGLGLAISASIVREFGGQLGAANRPEGGAEFTITLNRALEDVAAGSAALSNQNE